MLNKKSERHIFKAILNKRKFAQKFPPFYLRQGIYVFLYVTKQEYRAQRSNTTGLCGPQLFDLWSLLTLARAFIVSWFTQKGHNEITEGVNGRQIFQPVLFTWVCFGMLKWEICVCVSVMIFWVLLWLVTFRKDVTWDYRKNVVFTSVEKNFQN